MMSQKDINLTLPGSDEDNVDFHLSRLKQQREEYPEFDEMPYSERNTFMARILSFREQYQVDDDSIAHAVGVSAEDMMLISSEIEEHLEN